MDINQEIRRFLNEVSTPGRYVGGELNMVRKDPARMRLRMALCYPDVYEIGMSHLGLAVLYHLVNLEEDVYAERCFAPWSDMAARMRERGIPLFSLETGTPLDAFDVVGFSLQHELLFTNVITMLELAGIPMRAADRRPQDPILVAGGSGAHTPEPMAEVFDLFLPGDGEIVLPPMVDLFRKLKGEGASREEMIREAAVKTSFAYAPALYAPGYDGAGFFTGLKPLAEGAPAEIVPGMLDNLEDAPIPPDPIQSGVRSIHERITLEIMRGCTRGCRFCQAGMIKRPLRLRSPEKLLEGAKAIYGSTGYDEISLCSLSTSDYPELGRLMRLFNEEFEPLRVGLSLPSLRVGKNLQEVSGLAGAVRKAGLTLAPEAATDRLRRGMNKEITNQDLEEGVFRAFEKGWRLVKLYFMIGLPGESDDDVRAIADLARKISNLRTRLHKEPALVNVSVSTFVPKAHTPFQWSPMARPEEVREKQQLILGMGLPRRIRFRFHDSRMSMVEGMLARGDRRLFEAVREAQARGAGFDAWKERFNFRAWEDAFQASGTDPEHYLYREREPEESFPWDHILAGPSRSFLQSEYERSKKGEFTPYCEDAPCHNCGLDPRLCADLKKKRGKEN